MPASAFFASLPLCLGLLVIVIVFAVVLVFVIFFVIVFVYLIFLAAVLSL